MVRSPVARFARFADLVELDDASLTKVVEGQGDAPERVWAAWVIALRRPSDAGALLEHAAMREPSEGVRAHLALMLVAHGERSAALAMALHDPSALVRASASRCLARLAEPVDPDLNEALAVALRDPAPDVRGAVLDGLRTDAPEPIRRRVKACLADGSLDVRRAAVDYLLRVEGFSASLGEQAPRETNDALFATLVDAWIAAEGSRVFSGHTASWPAPEIQRLLDLGFASKLEVADLEGWLSRDEPAIDGHLSALDLPLGWLLTFAVRFARMPVDQWTPEYALRLTTAARVAPQLHRALDATSSAELGQEERRLVHELAALIERNAREQYPTGSLEELALRGDDEWDAEDEGEAFPWVFGIELWTALQRLVKKNEPPA